MMADPMAGLGASSGAPDGRNRSDAQDGGKQVVDPMALHWNLQRIERIRSVMGMASGCVAGICGLTGLQGLGESRTAVFDSFLSLMVLTCFGVNSCSLFHSFAPVRSFHYLGLEDEFQVGAIQQNVLVCLPFCGITANSPFLHFVLDAILRSGLLVLGTFSFTQRKREPVNTSTSLSRCSKRFGHSLNGVLVAANVHAWDTRNLANSTS